MFMWNVEMKPNFNLEFLFFVKDPFSQPLNAVLYMFTHAEERR